MSTFASKIYRTRNVVELENQVLVEWRQLGHAPESCLCGSMKVLNRVLRRLRREGGLHPPKPSLELQAMIEKILDLRCPSWQSTCNRTQPIPGSSGSKTPAPSKASVNAGIATPKSNSSANPTSFISKKPFRSGKT